MRIPPSRNQPLHCHPLDTKAQHCGCYGFITYLLVSHRPFYCHRGFINSCCSRYSTENPSSHRICTGLHVSCWGVSRGRVLISVWDSREVWSGGSGVGGHWRKSRNTQQVVYRFSRWWCRAEGLPGSCIDDAECECTSVLNEHADAIKIFQHFKENKELKLAGTPPWLATDTKVFRLKKYYLVPKSPTHAFVLCHRHRDLQTCSLDTLKGMTSTKAKSLTDLLG